MIDPRETIQRLLNLSHSCNEHEAAAAYAKAQELMSKHQIDAAQFAHDAGAAPDAILNEELHSFGATHEQWYEVLAVCIAEANGCRVFTTVWRLANDSTERVLNILGTKESVATVRYMLAAITTQAREMCRWRCVGQGKRYRQAFLLGFSGRIRDRINEAARIERMRAAGNASRAGALVRLCDTQARIDATIKTLGLQDDGDPVYKYPSQLESAFERGARAADLVNLDTGAPLPAVQHQLKG